MSDDLVKDLRFWNGGIDSDKKMQKAAARIEQLEAALQKIIKDNLQSTRHPADVTQRGETIFDGYFGHIARKALEGEDGNA
jgi:hypothetical protein